MHQLWSLHFSSPDSGAYWVRVALHRCQTRTRKGDELQSNLSMDSTGSDHNRGTAFRWLLSHLRNYKRFALVYVVGTLLWQILTSLIPWLTGKSFDAVLSNPTDPGSFYRLAWYLCAIVLVRGFIGVVTTYSLDSIGNGVERDVREELYRELLRKSQSFFDRQKIGDLVARATGDASQINVMFQPGMEFLLIAIYGTIVPIAFITMLQPQLLLTPLLFVVVFTLAVRWHSQRLEPTSDNLQARYGAFNAHVTEVLSGIEAVHAAGQRSREQRTVADLAGAYRDAYVRQERVQALYLPPLILTLAIVGALGHSLVLVSQDRLTIGELVAYLGLLGLLQQPVEAFGISLMLVRMGSAGGKRIIETLNGSKEPAVSSHMHAGIPVGKIEFSDVSFSYGDTPVLQNVSFTIRAGETVALVGATGSGKSTLVKLMNRTYEIDSGQIKLDDKDLRAWDVKVLREHVVMIEQDVVLFSRSVSENISFSASDEATFEDIRRAATAAQAHDFILDFEHGYDTVIGSRGASLSGGQRQRLAIARALLANPRILILDDATSALDSATDVFLQEALHNVAGHCTTLLITHRLASIKSADRIIVLDKGYVIDQGIHEELIGRCALYQRIFSAYE